MPFTVFVYLKDSERKLKFIILS